MVLGLLGAHVSIGGGVHKAPERARNLGCDSMQIFTRNQMQWKARDIGKDEAEQFIENLEKFKIMKTMAHDSYLINLAAVDRKILMKSKDAFLEEISRAKKLGIDFLVFHPGAHMGAGESKGIKLISSNVREAIEASGDLGLRVLFETTAGQGSTIGNSFEQIAKLLELVGLDDRTGVCFDTCHCFAAGYDLSTEEGYGITFELFDDVIGLNRLYAFHINDSKGRQGSRLDRHENIGKGRLGLRAFGLLMNDRRFSKHPMVLETPNVDEEYEADLRVLQSLIGSKK